MNDNFSDVIIARLFAPTASIAAVYELRLRMLADMRTNTEHATHAQRTETVEEAIVEEYSLGPEETGWLRTTSQLRNKILHGNFRQAKDKLADLGVELPTGDVRAIRLPTDGTLPNFDELLESAKPITEADGSKAICSWLYWAAQTNFFARAQEAFVESLKILDRLRAVVEAEEDAANPAT